MIVRLKRQRFVAYQVAIEVEGDCASKTPSFQLHRIAIKGNLSALRRSNSRHLDGQRVDVGSECLLHIGNGEVACDTINQLIIDAAFYQEGYIPPGEIAKRPAIIWRALFSAAGRYGEHCWIELSATSVSASRLTSDPVSKNAAVIVPSSCR